MTKLRILILGYIVRGPLAGMTMHYLQYCLGLRKLGHDVFFLEDSGDTEYCCYHPDKNITDSDPTYGLKYASEVFTRYGLENNWAYYNKHTNEWIGSSQQKVKKIISEADVLINVSIANPIRSWLDNVPVRILIDTDPVFTQIRNLTDPKRKELCDAHNYFFTFGENFGKKDCLIPDDGFNWKATRQPAFLDAWKPHTENADSSWTTIMQWESYKSRIYNGQEFGMKSKSFEHFINIPDKNRNENFVLAIGDAPVELLNSHRWNLVNPIEVSKSIDLYQDFINHSKGEFAVAKHGYSVSNSGWFSERSVCYLATGKPVIVQNTGCNGILPTGNGLMTFDTAEEAGQQLKEISANYAHHCKSAREIAEEFFNSDLVLNRLLNML